MFAKSIPRRVRSIGLCDHIMSDEFSWYNCRRVTDEEAANAPRKARNARRNGKEPDLRCPVWPAWVCLCGCRGRPVCPRKPRRARMFSAALDWTILIFAWTIGGLAMLCGVASPGPKMNEPAVRRGIAKWPA